MKQKSKGRFFVSAKTPTNEIRLGGRPLPDHALLMLVTNVASANDSTPIAFAAFPSGFEAVVIAPDIIAVKKMVDDFCEKIYALTTVKDYHIEEFKVEIAEFVGNDKELLDFATGMAIRSMEAYHCLPSDIHHMSFDLSGKTCS